METANSERDILKNLLADSQSNEIGKILSLMHLAEKLKIELRYGRMSNGARECTAAHCWRLAILIILVAPQLSKPFDLQKALVIALIHDLVEAEAGDHHFLELEKSSVADQIYQKELVAIKNIKNLLQNQTGDDFYNYWCEFENLSSYEAKVVKALDKIEGYIQQNEAPLSTWTKEEAKSVFYYLDKFCDFEPYLKSLKEAVIEEAKLKLKKGKINLNEVMNAAKVYSS